MFSRFTGPYLGAYNLAPRAGLGSLLTGANNSLTSPALGLAKKGISWSTILSNTQKTLGVINQTIPTFYQIKPIINNAKTMFRVMNEFRNTSKPEQKTNANNTTSNTISAENTTNNNYYNQQNNSANNSPNFFL